MKKSELRQIIREEILSEINSKIIDYAKKQAPGMGFVPLSSELQTKYLKMKLIKEAVKHWDDRHNTNANV